jgi:polyisoprenoid-binding protein YceI
MRWLGLMFLTALPLAQAGAAMAEPSAWRFDGQHTAAHFAVKHLLIATVRGSFSHVEGRASIDDDDVARSWVTVEVHTDSLYSGSWARDQLLKGEQFLDVKSYPRILFRSNRVVQAPQGHLLVTGILTIRDHSREVTVEIEGPTPAVRDRRGRQVRAVVARTRFDRKSFGLTWQARLEGGGVELGDEVDVEVDIALVREAPTDGRAAWAKQPSKPAPGSAGSTSRP